MPARSPDDAELGRRLRDARTRAGLTQAELAERAGVPRTNMPGYERGTRRMRPAVAERLAGELDIHPEDLVHVVGPSLQDTLADIRDTLAEVRDALTGLAEELRRQRSPE